MLWNEILMVFRGDENDELCDTKNICSHASSAFAMAGAALDNASA